MKHYAIDQWVDLTRGIVAGDDAAQMLAHRRSGCADCNQLSDFTSKLTRACIGLASSSVSERSIRLARAIFPVRLQDRPKRGNRPPIEMIFDSFLAPSTAGRRSLPQAGWPAMYRTDDCTVDLRIPPELKSSRSAAIGQIPSHVLPAVDMGNLPVCLGSGTLAVNDDQ